MFNVVLYQPEIPPNTGNIMRLCANTGATLHLVGPLGFELDDRKLKRAGLDYRDMASVRLHSNWSSWLELNGEMRLWGFSTRGERVHSDASYRAGDALLFGPETRGLPREILDSLGAEHTLRLPMRPGSRSINLSNTVAAAVYEALRQLGYPGMG